MPVRLVIWIYNFCFPLVLLAMLPRFLLRMVRRGHFQEKFGQRLGLYTREVREKLKGAGPVWIHAVSVGEVMQALKLIAAWRQTRPGDRVVLSTTTSTGFRLASERVPAEVEVIYHPVDFGWGVRRALDVVRPRAILLVEAEVWPNLVWQASRRHIPVCLCNARLSPRSERRYRRFQRVCGPLFNLLTRIFLPDEGEREKWQGFGVDPDRLEVAGNPKYDDTGLNELDTSSVKKVLEDWGVEAGRPIFCGGSTHAGEEQVLAEVYGELRREIPGLFLVLVPRHVERAPTIGTELAEAGWQVGFRSRSGGQADLLIVDTTGELREWYAVSDVVFIGKSFLARGGQNPMEAVAAGKPVLFGPHMENFASVTDGLRRVGGARQVRDRRELATVVRELLNDPVAGRRMAERGAEILDQHRGAAGRMTRAIQQLEKAAV